MLCAFGFHVDCCFLHFDRDRRYAPFSLSCKFVLLVAPANILNLVKTNDMVTIKVNERTKAGKALLAVVKVMAQKFVDKFARICEKKLLLRKQAG